MIRVLFFGPISAATGEREISIEPTAGLTLGGLRDKLAAQYPDAMPLATMMALNGEHARDLALPVTDGSEVAFMAKFSGG